MCSRGCRTVEANIPSMAPTPIKLVRGALELPRTKVAVPQGGGGGVDDEWYQLQLINPPDSADVMDSATADHRSMRMFELSFWYHQFAIVLNGEMVCQDAASGEVYRGHEGDLFHWAPGLRLHFGGRFRALGTKTPIPMRWVRTARGKEERLMHTLSDEILLEGAAPDETREVRRNSPLPSLRRIKFVRGALNAETGRGRFACQPGGPVAAGRAGRSHRYQPHRQRLHRGAKRGRGHPARSPMA